MKIKNEEHVFNPEVLNALNSEEEEDLSHAQKIAKENLSRHTDLTDTETLEQLKQDLADIDPVSEKHAYKILDVMPQFESTIRAIFSKERTRVEQKHIDEILSIVRSAE